MNTEELRILLALESDWTVCVNGNEFIPLRSSDISLHDSTIQIGPLIRKVLEVEWLRPNSVRIRARAKSRAQPDTLTFYPGDRLPSTAGLRRRRRAFQNQMERALCAYYKTRKVIRQSLYSDRRHGIGGAYPRFLFADRAAIAVDPDESQAVVNGVMRAALLWAPLVRRRVAVVVPYGRHHTLASRLRLMPRTRDGFDWLQWDGEHIQPLQIEAEEPETRVHEFWQLPTQAIVHEICALAPGLLQAVPHIAGNAVSVRLRGIELARVSETEVLYPLGQPLEDVIREVDAARRHGSRHPLARAYEERWLESILMAQIQELLPAIDRRHIYPQVPSFVGGERNIIDLLTVTEDGRLVVIEIKASADPDLPFQALDYWIAVERHRKAGDFQSKGYFAGRRLQDKPAILVLVAPLLAFHRTLNLLVGALPDALPLMEVGINQSWKREIKILRRRGLVS